MALFPRTKGRIWTWLAEDRVFMLGVVAFVAALEAVGRKNAKDDIHDALGVMALLALVAVMVVKNRRAGGMTWGSGLVRRFRRIGSMFARVWVHLDLDLRRDPPLLRRRPRIHVVALLAAVAFAAVAFYFRAATPHAVRRMLAEDFYTGYLVLLAASWIFLITATFVLGVFPVALAHLVSELRQPRIGARGRVRQSAIDFLYLAAMVFAITVLPAWCGLVLVILSWAVTTIALAWPGAPQLDLLWWPDEERRGSPRVLTWTWFFGNQSTILVAVLVGSALLFGGMAVDPRDLAGAGEGFAAARSSDMPVTSSMAIIFTWAAASACSVAAFLFVRLYWSRRARDPARHVPTTVHVRGLDAERLEECRLLLSTFGIDARGGERRDVDVSLVVDETCSAPAEGFPLRLRACDIGTREVRERILRRDQIQRRRLFFRGLEAIFKAAAGRDFDRGEGFWLAPHQWFVPGLARDGEDELTGDRIEAIGPLYDQVIPHAAASHAHLVFSALEIDLVFVEDGVGFRRLRRVLRLAFDVYDMFGGARRIEERHLTGIRGVRALIHEFSHDRPFEAEVYPEPDYEMVGRARILHVFRDRDEDEAPVETPVGVSSRPVVSLGV